MKFIFVLSLLLSVASTQVLQPLDFDPAALKDIWESPELQRNSLRSSLKKLVAVGESSMELKLLADSFHTTFC
jgi:hypothetical protein